MKQVPSDPRETKQLHSLLNLAIGEITEISLNTRTHDGMTNGSGNVIKLIHVNQTATISGIIWVQFDHADVGEKTRHHNRQLYVLGIEPTWTPIKPITSQFATGRTRTVQVARKQFPLRPAAAITIHRSQGDTETKIVVNFDTRKSIPHIHYVGLSRVTTIDGLYIIALCENKISVSGDVQTEMRRLRTEGKLSLSIIPTYKVSQISFKFRRDINYSQTDNLYLLEDDKYTLSTNDASKTDLQDHLGVQQFIVVLTFILDTHIALIKMVLK